MLTDSQVSMEVAGMTYKPLSEMEEICTIFSVSRQTVYQWIQEGLLKLRKVRSRVYFLREDLDQLIQK